MYFESRRCNNECEGLTAFMLKARRDYLTRD